MKSRITAMARSVSGMAGNWQSVRAEQGAAGLPVIPLADLCLSEIKHAHTDDEVRQEMAWAKCDQRHVLFAATARPC